MHKKVYEELKSLKKNLIQNCKNCHGHDTGCMVCASKYDLMEMIAMSMIPIKYWKFKLSDLKQEMIGVKEIKTYISRLSEAHKEGVGVFAYGKNGNGKTLCACLIGKEALKQGYTVRFTFLGEIISAFADAMYDQEAQNKLRKDILEVDFLIIDDIDKAYISEKSKYVDSILDTLFRTRVQNKLPVVITANKTIGEILTSHEEVVSKSLLSLFDESVVSILFMGNDHRAEIKKDNRKRFLGEDS